MNTDSFLSLIIGLVAGVVLTFITYEVHKSGHSEGTADRAVTLESLRQNDLLNTSTNSLNVDLQRLDQLRDAIFSKHGKKNAKTVDRLQSAEQIDSISRSTSAAIASKPEATHAGTVPSSQALDNLSISHVADNKKRCPYDFKVYVYDIPQTIDSIRISEEARRNYTLHICKKCILEQFALEYIVLDFFIKFCGRTRDPFEADFFYLPIVRDAEYRQAQQSSTRNRDPSSAEKALLLLMEKNDSSLFTSYFRITDEFWHKHRGGNHILVMPAPVTNFRHETSRRGFFHYMSHLHTPIFLNVEYSVAFVREYPICATRKNIVVPYPTTDPDLYSGKLTSQIHQRPYLLYYVGGMHGECMLVRKAIRDLMWNSSQLTKHNYNIVPKRQYNQQRREQGFGESVFCPVPIGDSPSSKRMYDVMNFGCIPVVLSDDLVWSFSYETGGPFNRSSFAIHLPQAVVHFDTSRLLTMYAEQKELFGVLPSGVRLYDLLQQSVATGGSYIHGVYINPLVQILQRVSADDVRALRKGVNQVSPMYRYYAMNTLMNNIPTSTHVYPDGDAFEVISALLSERKAYGIDNLTKDCQAERFRKGHKYVANYACDHDRPAKPPRKKSKPKQQQ